MDGRRGPPSYRHHHRLSKSQHCTRILDPMVITDQVNGRGGRLLVAAISLHIFRRHIHSKNVYSGISTVSRNPMQQEYQVSASGGRNLGGPTSSRKHPRYGRVSIARQKSGQFEEKEQKEKKVAEKLIVRRGTEVYYYYVLGSKSAGVFKSELRLMIRTIFGGEDPSLPSVPVAGIEQPAPAWSPYDGEADERWLDERKKSRRSRSEVRYSDLAELIYKITFPDAELACKTEEDDPLERGIVISHQSSSPSLPPRRRHPREGHDRPLGSMARIWLSSSSIFRGIGNRPNQLAC